MYSNNVFIVLKLKYQPYSDVAQTDVVSLTLESVLLKFHSFPFLYFNTYNNSTCIGNITHYSDIGLEELEGIHSRYKSKINHIATTNPLKKFKFLLKDY